MSSPKAKKLSVTPPSARLQAEPATDSKALRQAKALAEGTKRLTLDMSVATHRALKRLAADQGRTMRDFVMEALRSRGLRE